MVNINTYQDLLKAKKNNELETFLITALDGYRASDEYSKYIRNYKYFKGENPTIMAWHSTIATDNDTVDLFAKIRVPSGIFQRLITLQVNRLWYNEVQLDNDENKAKLGLNFDKTAKDLATNAAIYGVCYGFWNFNRLQMFTPLEYFPFPDERTGLHMAGLRFWSIDPDDNTKPWVIQLFEIDGWTEWNRLGSGPLSIVTEKQAYKITKRIDGLGEQIEGAENYPSFPILPMYTNTNHTSELTTPIRAKIDLYDAIMTTFGDTVLKTKALYWLFEGYSGSEKYLTEMRDTIQRLGIIAPNDDTTAKAQTVELPYQATVQYLADLENAIFMDAMVANPNKISGSDMKEIGIKGIFNAEKMKLSDAEWQGADFIRRLLILINLQNEMIQFKQETIANDMDITTRLAMYPEIDLETKLIIDPLFNPDMIQQILERVNIEPIDDKPKEIIDKNVNIIE